MQFVTDDENVYFVTVDEVACFARSDETVPDDKIVCYVRADVPFLSHVFTVSSVVFIFCLRNVPVAAISSGVPQSMTDRTLGFSLSSGSRRHCPRPLAHQSRFFLQFRHNVSSAVSSAA